MFAVSDSIEGLTKALNAVKKAPAETEPIVVDAGLSGIEVAIAELANAVRSYVQNAGSGENRLKIFTGEEGAGNYPVPLLWTLQRNDGGPACRGWAHC